MDGRADSCHGGSRYDSAGPWGRVAQLDRTTSSPASCQMDGGCAYKCAESYRVSVSSSTLTLTPTAPYPAGCDCTSGTGTIDTFTHQTSGRFEDGSAFVATPNDGFDFTAMIVITDSTARTACQYDYQVTEKEIDATAAAAGGIWLVMMCMGFAVPMAGIFYCIKSKREKGLGEPTPMAYLGCLLIFCFSGPCFMWIPFVIDSCYQSRTNWNMTITQQTTTVGAGGGMYGNPSGGMPLQQQPIMATAVAVQPMATATAVSATAAPVTGAPPGYGGQQPPVATVTAVQQAP